jgi:hypothetical protein
LIYLSYAIQIFQHLKKKPICYNNVNILNDNPLLIFNDKNIWMFTLMVSIFVCTMKCTSDMLTRIQWHEYLKIFISYKTTFHITFEMNMHICNHKKNKMRIL